MSSLLVVLRRLLDPRTWASLVRLVNHHGYDHVEPRRALVAPGSVRLSPTVSLRNGHRISIGARTRVGDGVCLWAGNTSGRIVIGSDCSLGPRVYVTASDYELAAGVPVKDQGKVERDVVVGDGCWLGAGVILVAGVTLGDGVVVGAGSVVTRDLPTGSVAAGVPARVLRARV